MIRMMSGIIPVDYTNIVNEESSHDVISNISKNYYELMKESHHEWINEQKELFSSLKNNDSDISMYKILTNKYDMHMSKPRKMLVNAMKKVAKFQLQYLADDTKRLKVIHEYLDHHPGLRDRYISRPTVNIGYEFNFSYIDDKHIEEIYSRLREDILKGRDISKDKIADRIYSEYRDLSKLDQKVLDNMNAIIKRKENISIGEIVDRYKKINGTRVQLMKDNIKDFNRANDKIGLEHKAMIAAWHKKMKHIKDSGVDGCVANAAYTRCMTNMSIINDTTQHLLDSCYIIMKTSLRIIADSDKASTELTKTILNYMIDLNLDRG